MTSGPDEGSQLPAERPIETIEAEISGLSPETLRLYQPKESNIPERQERVRGRLSLIFAGIFGGVVLSPIILVPVVAFLSPLAANDVWTIVKDWLQITLPAVTGIVGSAFGFYFGTRDNSP